MPVPFGMWMFQARLLSLLPNPPLTGDQVMLMRDDNIVTPGTIAFADLGISAGDLEKLLPLCLEGESQAGNGC